MILAQTAGFGGQQEESASLNLRSRLPMGHLFPSHKNRVEVHGRIRVRVPEVSGSFADNARCLLADKEFQFEVREEAFNSVFGRDQWHSILVAVCWHGFRQRL
jgi:hypothetical protein